MQQGEMSLLLISPRSPWTRGAGARLCISQPTGLTACKLCFKICFIQNGRSRSAVVTKAVTGCLRNGAGQKLWNLAGPPHPSGGCCGLPWSVVSHAAAQCRLGAPKFGNALSRLWTWIREVPRQHAREQCRALGGGVCWTGKVVPGLVWRRVRGRPGVPGPSPAEWVGLGPGRSTGSSAQKRRLSGGGKGGRLCGLWASESPS